MVSQSTDVRQHMRNRKLLGNSQRMR